MSGERPNQRERVDAMISQMVKSGAKPEYAKEKAIAAAKKDDRKKR